MKKYNFLFLILIFSFSCIQMPKTISKEEIQSLINRAESSDLKAQAESGDPKAQYELGIVYRYKLKDFDCGGYKNVYKSLSCFKIKKKKAIYWFEKSAIRGYSKAQYQLGNIYYHDCLDYIQKEENKETYLMMQGQIVFRDYEYHKVPICKVAFYWTKKSAEQGNLLEQKMSQGALSSMYRLGHGVPIDYEKAEYWYKKAQ